MSWLMLTEVKSGDRKNAESDVQLVEALLDTVEKPIDFVEICWNLAQTHSLLGNPQEELVFLGYAHREVMARAQKISNTNMRKSYLTNVRQNRDIIAAWEKHSEKLEVKM